MVPEGVGGAGLRHVRRRVPARVVGDAPVVAAEPPYLSFPGTVVGGELVQDDDRVARARLFVVELGSGTLDKRHGESLRVGVDVAGALRPVPDRCITRCG